MPSSDPNATRGRASQGETSLSFPLNEALPVTTRLRFTQYTRFRPRDQASEATTVLITLPLPSSIPDNNSINTTGFDLGRLGNADLSALNQSLDSGSLDPLKQAIENGYSAFMNELKRVPDTFKVSMLKGLALAPIIPDDWQKRFELLGGVVQNPHTNIVFNGVEIKSYSFSWRLSPRSQQESDMLNNIINTIKMRMYPEMSFGKYALDYPDTVNVEFTGNASKYLPKIYKAFVTDFNVSYGDSGQVAMYKSGAPVVYDMQMRIKELNIITRDRLRGEEDGSLGEA